MRIISGGQTGVDRAALDAARALGMPCGGFCPRGRRAEDGRIPEHYPLTELASREYAARTRANVEAADATLVLVRDELSGGTKLTVQWCRELDKPVFVVRPHEEGALEAALQWLSTTQPAVLNVAGPRASQWPSGSHVAYAFLLELFQRFCALCRDSKGQEQNGGAVRDRSSGG